MIERPENPYETATGRKLGYTKTPERGFFKIVFDDEKGGSIPSKYSGLYTSFKEVDIAIKAFVEETFQVAEENSPKRRAS